MGKEPSQQYLTTESTAKAVHPRPSSLGPVTEEGKAISSVNALVHGLEAKLVLMPDEKLEERLAVHHGLGMTLRPRSPGEALLSAKIADAFVRLDRLDHHREVILAQGVEQALRDSSTFKSLSRVRDALLATEGLAAMAETISAPVPFEDIRRVAPAMRKALDLVDDVAVPAELILLLRNAMNDVLLDAIIDVDPDTFRVLATRTRAVVAHLAAEASALQSAVEADRDRLMQDPTLGSQEEYRRLDRHRSRVCRELDGLFSMFRQLRDLAVPGESVDSSFVEVILKVVSRPLARL